MQRVGQQQTRPRGLWIEVRGLPQGRERRLDLAAVIKAHSEKIIHLRRGRIELQRRTKGVIRAIVLVVFPEPSPEVGIGIHVRMVAHLCLQLWRSLARALGGSSSVLKWRRRGTLGKESGPRMTGE